MSLITNDAIMQHFGYPGAVNDKVRAFFNAMYTGSGSPEGSITASVGSFYFDTTNGVMYAKQLGSGNTGWIAGISWVNLASYCVGDGTTDDTAAIAAATTAAGIGGRIYVPYGKTFAVTTWVPLAYQTIFGGGTIKRLSGSSRLMSINHVNGVTVDGLTLDGNSLAGDILFIGGSDNADTSVRRLTILNGTGTSAAGIQVNAAVRARIDDVDVSNCYWGILLNNACADPFLTRASIRNCLTTSASEGSGLYLSSVVRAKISNVLVSGCAGQGVYIASGASNCTLTAVHSISNGTAANDHRGFTFSGATTGHKLVGCHAESNIECGYYLSTTSTDISFDGCQAKANNQGNRAGGHGFEIDGKDIELVGCHSNGQLGNASGAGSGFAFGGSKIVASGCVAKSNYSAGFRAAGGTKCSYSACTAMNNNQGSNSFGGFQFDVSAGDITVTGGVSSDDQGGKTQEYGILVSGSATNVSITNVNLSGNKTAATSFPGGATFRVRAANCIGLNPVGAAVTQPAIPATTVAITNTTGVDCTVMVNGGTVSAITIGGTATGLTTGTVRVPAGQTIALTYTVAPTWQWFGD